MYKVEDERIVKICVSRVGRMVLALMRFCLREEEREGERRGKGFIYTPSPSVI
jgi:hypothetical protein